MTRSYGTFFYYVCYTHRSDADACPYGKYYPAPELEERVAAFALDLIQNPDTLREQVEASLAREKAAVRHERKRTAALARTLAKAESERENLIRLYRQGKLTDEEYDAHAAEIAERKRIVEAESERLKYAQRYVEYLEDLPRVLEDLLKDIPFYIDYTPRIRERVPVPHPERQRKVGKLTVEREGPGSSRKRTPEEMEALRREALRERSEVRRKVYRDLDLSGVVDSDGNITLEWFGGVCSKTLTSG